MSEWDISPIKVAATLTDNGSNMLAAFRSSTVVDEGVEVGEDSESEDSKGGEDFKREEMEIDNDTEIEEFERRELDHTVEFLSLNRVSCFCHTLAISGEVF